MYKLSLLLLALSFFSCRLPENKNEKTSPEDKLKMMDADRGFSKMSKEEGMKKAFINYIDDDGVLLRPNQYPLMGAEAIDYLTRINDTSFTMEWEPQKGYVANSGELGYTYGVFTLTPSTQDTVLYGTYVSIWKKQVDGSWKFVLDTGNEGIGQQVTDSAQ
jgi:ketosteroid isomerase-like protein